VVCIVWDVPLWGGGGGGEAIISLGWVAPNILGKLYGRMELIIILNMSEIDCLIFYVYKYLINIISLQILKVLILDT
jgi:hypothetical protein